MADTEKDADKGPTAARPPQGPTAAPPAPPAGAARKAARDDRGGDAPARSAAQVARQRAARTPTARELEDARAARFGAEDGSVAVDADPPNAGDAHGRRRVELVYLDGDGREVGRTPWEPEADDDAADAPKPSK